MKIIYIEEYCIFYQLSSIALLMKIPLHIHFSKGKDELTLEDKSSFQTIMKLYWSHFNLVSTVVVDEYPKKPYSFGWNTSIRYSKIKVWNTLETESSIDSGSSAFWLYSGAVLDNH